MLKKYYFDFLDYLKDIKKYSDLTIKTYTKPIAEALELSEIEENNGVIYFNITKYRLSIKDQKPKTIAKKLSSIKSFVSYLLNLGLKVKLKGATSIKVPKTLPKPVGTKYIFEAIESSSDLEAKLIAMFLYSFGLRISELANLKLEDIKNNFIRVTGKGNKQREIPTNEKVLKVLDEYKKFYNPKEYLFEKDGKQYTPRQLQYRLEKMFKQIGIKVTPHQLRHSFATDLLNNGARINDISELLGHSSLNATNIYTKLATTTKLKNYKQAHPLEKE